MHDSNLLSFPLWTYLDPQLLIQNILVKFSYCHNVVLLLEKRWATVETTVFSIIVASTKNKQQQQNLTFSLVFVWPCDL